jgi:hypothetical protein
MRTTTFIKHVMGTASTALIIGSLTTQAAGLTPQEEKLALAKKRR